MSAVTEISDEDYNELLKKALRYEVSSNFDFIYIILSLIYDAESIALVKENIELGTTDGSAYALELLDIFLAPDLKPRLYPLLDDIDVKEKLEKLQIFYPRQSYTEEETYNYLLNREITAVNRWTKACTLFAISRHNSFDINDSIIAHMFNHDALISELATSITYKYKPSEFRIVEKRMRLSDPGLHKVLNNVKNGLPTVFDLTLRLLQMPYFKDFNGLLMSQLVGKMDFIKLAAGEETGLLDEQDIFIIIGGKLQINNPSHQISIDCETNDIFGSAFFEIKNKGWRIDAEQNVFMLRFNINDMFNILTNNRSLARKLMQEINDTFNTENINTNQP
jgi:AAA family ATP:ADP antiporter